MSERSWFPTPEEVRARRAEREAEEAARVAAETPLPLPVPPLRSPENPFRKTTGLSLLMWTVMGSIGTAFLLGFLSRGHPERRSLSELMPFFQFVFYGTLLAWVLVKSRGGGLDLDRLWGRMPSWSEISGLGGILLTLMVFSMATMSVMLTFLSTLRTSGGDQNSVIGPGTPLVIGFLLAVVLAPLVEELVFRGILFQRWSLRWGIRRAAIINGCVFGALHLNFIWAGMLGLVACLLFARTGKLLVPTALHLTNNLIAFSIKAVPRILEAVPADMIAPTAPDPAPPSPAVFAVCSGVLLLFSVPFLARFIREHWPAKDQPPPYFQRA